MLDPIAIDPVASLKFSSNASEGQPVFYQIIVEYKENAVYQGGATWREFSSSRALSKPARYNPQGEEIPITPEPLLTGRRSTKAFSIYLDQGVDQYDRRKFTWHSSPSLYRCDWTVRVDPTRMQEPYNRLYIFLDNHLVKLPFGLQEAGAAVVCTLCPYQFSCLAGNVSGYLVGDDLPAEVTVTSTNIEDVLP